MQMQTDIMQTFSTATTAKLAGVHKDTLLRWLRSGLITEPGRDRNGWRSFNKSEVEAVMRHAATGQITEDLLTEAHEPKDRAIENLKRIDWDFTGAKTSYLTHSMHPYPAKFIPQIPNALIQELSSVGDTVGDIFCGSGTTLVEALMLKRNAVGVDANPLACLISRAKTTIINQADIESLKSLANATRELGLETSKNAESDLLSIGAFTSDGWRPESARLDFWFESHCIEELAEIRKLSLDLVSVAAKEVALVAMSSIIVTVSRQDSDTRYVRREKGILPGDTFKKFSRALDQHIHSASELSELIEPRFECQIIEGSLLSRPKIPLLDLVVCSPPYPNAYSYHLYHQSRMSWLGMNQPKFKKEEIGSHRKYSSKSKNAATVETFREEFREIFIWLNANMKPGAHACFVVGDSTLRGERIDNGSLISNEAALAGFCQVEKLSRTMQSSKKSFNPALGRIKSEDILILRRN